MRKFISFTFFVFLLSFSFQTCKAPQKVKIDYDKNYRIGFYNVENLFDTIDNPDKFDEDFTPTGKQLWNTAKYQKKLSDLGKVIAGMQYPALLGLCEVENEAVVKDLATNNGMASQGYKVAHFESPDKRGIDCALLYQAALFEVTNSDKIRIVFPKEMEEEYTSRDILYVQGKFLKTHQLHVFVNHWPSRRGGLEQSEPRRTLVASHLRKAIDSILKADPVANIVVIGDMNDEPDNNSILKTLNAGTPVDKLASGGLYNLMTKLNQQNKGTYNYRGEWNMLDNIIVSSNLLNTGSSIRVQNPTIYREEWMMYENPKYGPTPNRTYGGPNYYGGISDHLPVFVEVKVTKKK